MPVRMRLMFSSFAFCMAMGTLAQAQMPEQQKDILLSVNRDTVRWAAVYKMQPERPDDPYVHVRVFERRKGWERWRFNQLVFHMAVTPKALEASRIDGKTQIYNYKDVEIRASYRRWLDDPSIRAEVPVCDRDILTCIERLPR